MQPKQYHFDVGSTHVTLHEGEGIYQTTLVLTKGFVRQLVPSILYGLEHGGETDVLRYLMGHVGPAEIVSTKYPGKGDPRPLTVAPIPLSALTLLLSGSRLEIAGFVKALTTEIANMDATFFDLADRASAVYNTVFVEAHAAYEHDRALNLVGDWLLGILGVKGYEPNAFMAGSHIQAAALAYFLKPEGIKEVVTLLAGRFPSEGPINRERMSRLLGRIVYRLENWTLEVGLAQGNLAPSEVVRLVENDWCLQQLLKAVPHGVNAAASDWINRSKLGGIDCRTARLFIPEWEIARRSNAGTEEFLQRVPLARPFHAHLEMCPFCQQWQKILQQAWGDEPQTTCAADGTMYVMSRSGIVSPNPGSFTGKHDHELYAYFKEGGYHRFNSALLADWETVPRLAHIVGCPVCLCRITGELAHALQFPCGSMAMYDPLVQEATNLASDLAHNVLAGNCPDVVEQHFAICPHCRQRAGIKTKEENHN